MNQLRLALTPEPFDPIDYRQALCKTPLSPRPLSNCCSKCRAFLDVLTVEIPSDRRDYSHYETWSELLKSALNGCSVCYQFIRDARPGRHPVARDTPLEVMDAVYALQVQDDRINVNGALSSPESNNLEWIHGEVAISRHLQHAPKTQAMDYDNGDYASTLDSLPLCKQWLQKCLLSHGKCSPNPLQVLPSRLIAIGEGHPRLCLAEEIEANATYATLSHCWGSLKFQTLTSTSLPQFKRQIPPEALPKTFRDAIFIARYLGFKYLWIDSLCIVQDSQVDWAIESARMEHVYGSCDLNIAASSARDASIGCFFRREKVWRCRVSSREGLCDIVPRRWASQTILDKRGWVIQERHLSTRTLHFTDLQVFWECNEAPCSEFFPDPTEGLSTTRFRVKRQDWGIQDWVAIVCDYTTRQLTKSSDKLVALDGLANAIQGKSSIEYVWGLWRKDLEIQLCWQRGRGTLKRIYPPTAPSWSWASRDGPVRFLYQTDAANTARYRIHIQIQSIQVQRGAPGRQLVDGRARLLCHSFGRGTIGTRPKPPMEAIPVIFDSRIVALDLSFDEDGHPDNESKGGETGDIDSAYFLPVYSDTLAPISPYVYGLILKPTREAKGEYCRIGMFEQHEILDQYQRRDLEEKYRELGRAMPNISEESIGETRISPSTPEMDCVEVLDGEDGKQRYVIDIV